MLSGPGGLSDARWYPAFADSSVVVPDACDVADECPVLGDLVSLRVSRGILVTGGLILYGPQFPYGSIGQRTTESAREHRNTCPGHCYPWLGILLHRPDYHRKWLWFRNNVALGGDADRCGADRTHRGFCRAAHA